VAMAKRTVYGYCDIDMIAGPSEIMVVADETANPVFVAADLLSQAEHDILASSILVTTSEDIAKEVQRELEAQLAVLERKEIAGKSIADYGAIIIVESLKDAATVVNRIAPEHLELCVKDPFAALGEYKECGCDIPWQLFHRAFGRLFCRTQPCAPHKRYGKILLTFKSFGFYEEKQHYFIYKRCPSKG